MSERLTPFQGLGEEPHDEPDRLLSLSDGIFAFAMTLLAINLDDPRVGTATPQEVTTAVLNMLPELAVFVTSFLLVAIYWTVHRRLFRYVVKTDNLFTWLNIIELLFVALLPVATGLFDTYGDVPIVVIAYGGTLLCIGITSQLLWDHASRGHRLIDPDLPAEKIRYFSFRGQWTIAFYVAYIILGLLLPQVGRIFMVGFLALGYPLLPRVYSWLRRRNWIAA